MKVLQGGLFLLLTVSVVAQKPRLCRIHHADLLFQHEETGEMKDFDHTECSPIGDEGEDLVFYKLGFEDNYGFAGNRVAGMFLEYDEEWVNDKVMTVPYNVKPNFYHSHEVAAMTNGRSLMRSLSREVTPENANKMILARVSTPDETPGRSLEEIYDYVFGEDETSFTNIHNQCSLGYKSVVPYNASDPVLEFSVSQNISSYTFGSFYAEVEPMIERFLGIPTGTINSKAEYISLVAPNGLRPTATAPNFRFVAAGAYNSWKSVVTSDWVDTPQVWQHELGHNYNLGHPWEDNILYGDATAVMGQVYRGTVYNCYNGVHYSYLGWMDDYTLELEAPQPGVVDMVDLTFYGEAPLYTPPVMNETMAPTTMNETMAPVTMNETMIPSPTVMMPSDMPSLFPAMNDTMAPSPMNDTMAPSPMNETMAPATMNETMAPSSVDMPSLSPVMNDTMAPSTIDETLAPATMNDTASPAAVMPSSSPAAMMPSVSPNVEEPIEPEGPTVAPDFGTTDPIPTIDPSPSFSPAPTSSMSPGPTPTGEPESTRLRKLQDVDVDPVLISENNPALVTLIEVNGIYIIYNRKVGINDQTNEYPDSVLLHRYREEGVSQSGTDLIAVLDFDQNESLYRNATYNIAVELCSVNSGDGENATDSVTLAFGTADTQILCPTAAPSTSAPTTTASPTATPVPTFAPFLNESMVPTSLNISMPSDMPSLFPEMNETMAPSTMNETTAPSSFMMPTLSPAMDGTMAPSGPMNDTMAPSGPFNDTMAPSGMMNDTMAPSGMMNDTMAPSGMMNDTMAPSGMMNDTMAPSGMMNDTMAPSGPMNDTMSPSFMMNDTIAPVTMNDTMAPASEEVLAPSLAPLDTNAPDGPTGPNQAVNFTLTRFLRGLLG